MSDAAAPLAERLAERLAGLARNGETMTYGALAAELGLRVAALTALLEATMKADAATGQPLRAAVMRGRLSDGLPARGFFDRAEALGLPLADPAGFVRQTRAQLALKYR